MNKIIEIGNLTRDPEMSMTQNGKTKAIFTVAVSRPYLNANNVRESDFIRFTAYEKTAELIGRYLTKGKKVAVEGSVRTWKYEKDGQTIYTTDFIVQHIQFLSPMNSAQPSQQDQEETQQEVSNPTGQFQEVQDDDELPF